MVLMVVLVGDGLACVSVTNILYCRGYFRSGVVDELLSKALSWPQLRDTAVDVLIQTFNDAAKNVSTMTMVMVGFGVMILIAVW